MAPYEATEIIGYSTSIWFDASVEQAVAQLPSDPKVEELIATERAEFLARLISLRGIQELAQSEQLIVSKAGYILFSTLYHSEADVRHTVDEVAVWVAPGAAPPIASDFSLDEHRWISNNEWNSPFLVTVSPCVPGQRQILRAPIKTSIDITVGSKYL